MATLVRKSDLNPAAEEEVSDLKISRNQNCNWRGHAKALPDGNHLLDSEKRYEFPGTWRVRFMGGFAVCLRNDEYRGRTKHLDLLQPFSQSKAKTISINGV